MILRVILVVLSIIFLILAGSITIGQLWLWIYTQVNPWIITMVSITVPIILFVLLPLTFVDRTRIAALTGLMISLFIIQIILYVWGFDLVYGIFNTYFGEIQSIIKWNGYDIDLRGMLVTKYSCFFFGLVFLDHIIEANLNFDIYRFDFYVIFFYLFIAGAIFIIHCFIMALIKGLWSQAGLLIIFTFLVFGVNILNKIVYDYYRNYRV